MKRKQILFLAPLIFIFDQATKFWIIRTIPQGQSMTVIPNFFDIVHITNKGAAFGLFSTMPETIRSPFFCILSILAIALIVAYYFRLKEDSSLPYFCLSLILGGAVGNLWDRFVRGEVTDFLSVHWYDHALRWQWGHWRFHVPLEWPAFNVADSAITIAVIGFAFFTLKSDSSKKDIKCAPSSSL